MTLIKREISWIDKLDRNIIPYVEYPGYDNRYPAVNGLGIEEYKVKELRSVSKQLYRIFSKVTRVFQKCPEDFMKKMDIPEKLIPYLNIPNYMNLPSFLSRFDFVLDENHNFKMVEINADTPCAIPEAYYGNGVFCKETGLGDVNDGCYNNLVSYMFKVFNKTYDLYIDLHTGKFSNRTPYVFSCFDDYIEDKGNTMFLMDAMQKAISFNNIPGDLIEFVSFYDLKVDDFDGSIILPDGRRANALYRLHPLEILIDEVSDDGDELGDLLLRGYQNEEFTMFNPPESIIMQCKGFQALVWYLNNSEEGKKIFTEEESKCIEQYMLPSYFETDFNEFDAIRKGEQEWIVKPIWGREGSGIKVIDSNKNILFTKEIDADDEIVQRTPNINLYQKYIRQPLLNCKVDDPELRSGTYTFSCFMLGNKSDALYARVSYDPIAGTEAYWVPLYYL